MKEQEGILGLYDVLALPLGMMVLGGVAYFYSLIMHATTP